jgi:1,2-diacylglycerol 3-alpha-glucosyltransferase
MRIGLFSDTYSPDINGVVSSIVTLQNALENLGHDVFVVTNQPKIFTTTLENNILRLPGIELKSMYGYTMSSPLHLRALKQIEEMKLDIIHVHTEFGIGLFARIVSKRLIIPLVSTYHTTYEDYTHYINPLHMKSVERLARRSVSKLSKLYGSSCQAMISPSEKTKEMLLGYGITREIYVIPTGLNLSRFDKKNTNPAMVKSLRAKYGISEETFVILYVGRLAKEKSIDYVIDGFNELDLAHQDIKLMIVGGGPDEEGLVHLVKTLKIEDKVIFTGKIPSLEVPAYYHASDAFVSASLTETQGMTFIEALAAECPLFARPDDVLTELVIEDKTGYYFKSTHEFASKVMHHLSKTKKQREEMCIAAKAQVRIYDDREFGKAVENVYQTTIHNYKKSVFLKNIRLNEDVAECTFESNDGPFKVSVSLQTYTKKGLKRLSMVDQKTIDELMEDEKTVLAYQACIRKIASKDRTRKEMYDFLTQKTELNIKQINDLIDHLEQRNYINDTLYANSAVSNFLSLLQGKQRIIRALKQKGIPLDLIEAALQQDDEENEIKNALRYAEKIMPTIKDVSLKMKQEKLSIKLLTQGYEYSIIDVVMKSLNFNEDERNQLDNCRKLAAKAVKRYSSKYEGSSLRNHVFNYLTQKGFEVDDINVVFNDMVWTNEQD